MVVEVEVVAVVEVVVDWDQDGARPRVPGHTPTCLLKPRKEFQQIFLARAISSLQLLKIPLKTHLLPTNLTKSGYIQVLRWISSAQGLVFIKLERPEWIIADLVHIELSEGYVENRAQTLEPCRSGQFKKILLLFKEVIICMQQGLKGFHLREILWLLKDNYILWKAFSIHS